MHTLGMVTAIVLAALVVGAVVPSRAPTPPPVDKSIPYCWSKFHGLYLPCMYSSKEYRA